MAFSETGLPKMRPVLTPLHGSDPGSGVAAQSTGKVTQSGVGLRSGMEIQPGGEARTGSETPSGTETLLPPEFTAGLARQSGKGHPLDPDTGRLMGSAFQADFSAVKIHTDPAAAELSRSIQARAFTHGSDIFFDNGEYQPDSPEGRHLLAHELTHTLQQGAVNPTGGIIQRSLFERGWNRLRRAGEWVGESLQAGKNWLLGRLTGMVQSIPGYRLFTVILGSDPLTRQAVARSGRNFIEAGLDVIPAGQQLKQKLEEEGALAEAAAWLDQQIQQLAISPGDILQQVRDLWNSLSLSDVRNPGGVMDRLLGIFRGPVNRIIRFAVNVAVKLLEIVKRYLLSKLREFVATRQSPTFYPLLTVVLGYDPITGEDVNRSGANILRGFISLHPEGDEQLRQMQESGTFQKAAEWIDVAIVRVRAIASGLRAAFIAAWKAITDIRSLMNPVGTFSTIYQSFRTPLVALAAFALEVASMILNFIKEALLRWLSAWARETPGYPLVTVLLGRDPFTQEVVTRSAENIIRGFMSLIPGGLEKYNQLRESGAIARLISWIEGAVAALDITWSYIRGLFITLWESFTLRMLSAPIAAFQRIINTFADPIRRLFAFIRQVIQAIVMFALEAMNFPFETIRSIVNNAMQAYEDIRRDPIAFFLNLLRAVKQGFTQFFSNIYEHLIGGLRTWLFGELNAAGISPPADLSLRSILGFVMEVLGVTVSNIWDRLAARIGQERVDRIRAAMDRLSGIWTFIKDVYQRGPVAIWEYVRERLSNLWDIVLEQIRGWIVTRIIQQVTARLLSMLDPSGIMAVVNSFIAFYRAVQSFMEKLREMLEIVNSFVAGVANIARGTIGQAANYLENALAQGIPVAIGFLANQVGLRGLGRRIAEMIEAIRERINAAIDWLIDRALAAGSALLEMGRSAVGAVRDWWSRRRPVQLQDGSRHELYVSGNQPGARVMMASAPQPYTAYLNQLGTELNLPEAALSPARTKAGEIEALMAQNVPESQQEAHGNLINALVDELAVLTGNLPLPQNAGTNTPPVYGPLRQGFGTFARVAYMQSPHDMGSSPSVQNTPEFEIINNRRDGSRSFYVKGHLLNDNIGGPGNTWSNLTPLSQLANGAHERDFERFAKLAVNGTASRISSSPSEKHGHMINFQVTAVYGRSVPPAADQLINPDTEDYPSGYREDMDPILLSRIIRAEQYVPAELRCSAELFDRNNQITGIPEVVIPNEIHHGSLNHYELRSSPRELFRLSDHAGKPDTDAAVTGLMQLNLIGRTRAGEIVRSYREHGRMLNYVNQLGISRKAIELANPRYQIRP
jgi:phage-related protein